MEKKNYTLLIPLDNINRMRYLRDLTQKRFDPNDLINEFIEKMLDHYEEKYNVDKNDHKKTIKCNKCSSFMKIINYNNEKYYACTAYPKCKNMKLIKED